MVHEHDGQHGLGDGGGANADAGIVTPGGDHLHRVAMQIDALSGETDTGGRLEGKTGEDVLAAGDPAEDAPGMIAQEALGPHLVPMLGTLLLDTGEAVADLHPLDRVDAHEGVGDIRIQSIEDRLTEPGRHPGGDDIDAGADGIALLAQGVHKGFEFRHLGGIGAEKGVAIHLVPI